MKKYISLALVAIMIASLFAIGTVGTSAATATTMPDWTITEICPDNYAGDAPHESGYADNKDPFEFIEIVNTSGRVLNIYDYCMTYCGSGRTNVDEFENRIVEITPIKAGNFLDGSVAGWSTDDYAGVSVENLPQNPESGLVEPGEVVVLWSFYNESGYTMWNDGKGMQFEDFRSWHKIPENVKVFAYDANSTTGKGGHDKNFNVKNSACGTYGIALYTDELNNLCNVEGGEKLTVPYTSYDGFACWASLDFAIQIAAGHIEKCNITYEFTYDFGGFVPNDTAIQSTNGSTMIADGRRMILLSHQNWVPSAGTLSTLQKMTLGIPLEAGETFVTASDDTLIYAPTIEGGELEGYLINDVLYKLDSPYAMEGPVFTAETAGVYTFEFKYTNDNKTYSKVVELVKEEETTVAEEETSAPEDDETTVAPGGDENTTAAPGGDENQSGDETTKPSEGGCGGVIAGGIAIVALLGTAIVIKKRD